MAQPKVGGSFRYNGDEPIGVDAGALIPGTIVTVREIVPAGEPGAHDDTEDAAVIEWTSPGLVSDDEGMSVAEVPRAMSVGVDAFPDLFVGA